MNMQTATRALYAVLVAFLVIVPFQEFVYIVFVMKLLCFALFASAFNLLLGYTGLLSFGHAAFFGGAAYVTAHVCKEWGFTPELGILAGMVYAGITGYIFGSLAIRRQGIYFAMITLALSQLIFFLALQLPFTFGEDGIQGVPRGSFLGLIDLSGDTALYYFVLAIFLVGFLLIQRAIHSPFGQVLKSIRENEPRAISLGYDVKKFKLLAFVISATIAGMAGSTKALVFQLATLTDVQWQMSGEVVLMTILGGIGTILGPIIGAGVVIGLQNYLAGIGSFSTIVLGAIFVVCVLAFRRGLVGEWLAYLERRREAAEPRNPYKPTGSR